MLIDLHSHLKRQDAIHVVGAQVGFAALLCSALALFTLGATTAVPAEAHTQVAMISRAAPRPAVVRVQASVPSPANAPEDPGLIRLQDMSPDAARQWNASHPIAKERNAPAQPFNLAAEGVLDEARATDCMTAAIYYEAGFESLEGKRAVGQVIINRLRNPLFPKTVCGVVFQGSDRTSGCQFTFTCDGALARKPDEEAWESARKVAIAALHGYVMKKVGNATHYHADYVAPYWSPSLVKVAVVGQHIFYRWTGGLGLPPAFGGRYAGGEMQGLQIATLDNLARGSGKAAMTAATAVTAPTETQQAQKVEAEPAPAPAETANAPLVVASSAAQDALAVVAPEALDWQGRPRKKLAPRLARPTTADGF